MHRLANLIVFDNVDNSVKEAAKAADITVYHIDEVINKGKERI